VVEEAAAQAVAAEEDDNFFETYHASRLARALQLLA